MATRTLILTLPLALPLTLPIPLRPTPTPKQAALADPETSEFGGDVGGGCGGGGRGGGGEGGEGGNDLVGAACNANFDTVLSIDEGGMCS